MQRYVKSGSYAFIGNNIAYVAPIDRYLQIGRLEGKTIMKIKLPNDIKEIQSFDASGVSNKIAMSTNNSKVHIFDVGMGKFINAFSLGNEYAFVERVVFSPNGKYIATITNREINNTRVAVFNLESAKHMDESVAGRALSPSFSQNSEFFTYLDSKGKMTVIDIIQYKLRKKLEIQHSTPSGYVLSDYYTNAILSADNKHIIALTRVGMLSIDDFLGNNIVSYDYHNSYRTDVRIEHQNIKLTPDGNRIVIVFDGKVLVFDAKRLIPQFKMSITKFTLGPILSFSADSTKMIITSPYSGTHFLKFPKDHADLLEMKLPNITLLPEYILKLQRDKIARRELPKHKIYDKITDIITSYT